jgi:hypothetical protein
LWGLFYFHVTSDVAQGYKDYLSNTEFFEPIYEEKKEFVQVVIGNPAKIIKIHSNGNYSCENRIGRVAGLQDFLNDYTEINDSRIPWPVTVNTGFKIGCSEFSISDLQKVIDTYKRNFS